MKKAVLISIMVLLILSMMSISRSVTPQAVTKVVRHGADFQSNSIYPAAASYIPNAWQLIEDLGINEICLSIGQEGDVWKTDMNVQPNWAQNFETLLATAASHGVKVTYHVLGSAWGGYLGIVPPSMVAEGGTLTPIATAKTMIDKLAGNNALGHNFISDPRILVWYVDNEPDISDPETLNWIIQISDYIRSKGGKTLVGDPRLGQWGTGEDFHLTEPLLRGHVDYLERHLYAVQTLVHFTNPDGSRNWDAWEAEIRRVIQHDMIDGRGNFTVDQLMLGEFGIWRGTSTDMGVTATFTDQDRQEYYTRFFRSMDALGIKHWAFCELFEERTPPAGRPQWALVDKNGQIFPYAYDIVKTQAIPAAQTPEYGINPPPYPILSAESSIFVSWPSRGLRQDLDAYARHL